MLLHERTMGVNFCRAAGIIFPDLHTYLCEIEVNLQKVNGNDIFKKINTVCLQKKY